MRTIWQALAWKEWHEHKWKLASVTTILISITAIPLYGLDRNSMPIAALMVFFCAAPLAVFIGGGVAAGESARGTFNFTHSLPVDLRNVAASKLIFGLMTCVLPVFITLAALIVVSLAGDLLTDLLQRNVHFPLIESFAGDNDETGVVSWFFGAATPTVLASGSLFIWTIACGVARKDEISASTWSLLAIALSWAAAAFVTAAVGVGDWSSDPLARLFCFGTLPAGIAIPLFEPFGYVRGWWLIVTLAVLVHGRLAHRYLTQFGQKDMSGARSPREATGDKPDCAPAWAILPRKWRILAIAWKQIRETGPLALAGLAGAPIVSFFVYWINGGPNHVNYVQYFAMLFLAYAYIGAIVALLIGIGAFYYDLPPELNTFWRSRPIDPDSWFWTKFGVGMLVIAAVFLLPIILIPSIVNRSGSLGLEDQVQEIQTLAVVGFAAIYAAAVAANCLVRQATYAAILAIGSIVIGFAPAIYYFGEAMTTSHASWILGVIAVISTIVGWLAVRNDWGQKSRY